MEQKTRLRKRGTGLTRRKALACPSIGALMCYGERIVRIVAEASGQRCPTRCLPRSITPYFRTSSCSRKNWRKHVANGKRNIPSFQMAAVARATERPVSPSSYAVASGRVTVVRPLPTLAVHLPSNCSAPLCCHSRGSVTLNCRWRKGGNDAGFAQKADGFWASSAKGSIALTRSSKIGRTVSAWRA